jgi:putative transposase
MKFAFIFAEKATWPIVVMCAVLKVSASGFYAWLKREPSNHDKKDQRLKVLIGESFERSRKTYGSPRVHADLADEHIGRNRVIRLMQQEKLVARVRRRYRSTTMSEHDQPIAENVLNREFEADAPNQRWVGDTTELLTTSGVFYLAAIVDLYARIVVGWAMSAVNDRHLAIAALDEAIKRRRPDIGLLHHSDRGSTYTSEDYRKILEKHGIVCSMSRTGNCYDNAAMESWFSTFKFELGETFESIRRGKDLAFEYIEVFYNQRRRHSSIGYVAPAEFEQRYHDSQRSLTNATEVSVSQNSAGDALYNNTRHASNSMEGSVSQNRAADALYNNTHGRDRSGHV